MFAERTLTDTPAECADRDALMKQSFAVLNDGVYDMGLALLCERLRLPAA